MESTTVFYPCPYNHIPCKIHNCLNFSSWFVNRIDGPVGTGFNLCTECCKNLISTAPAELIEGGVELEAKLRTEYDQKLLQQSQEINQLRVQVESLVNQAARKKIIEQLGLPVELAPVVSEEPEVEDKTVYRCLECDKEFKDKRSLSNHMRIHQQGE